MLAIVFPFTHTRGVGMQHLLGANHLLVQMGFFSKLPSRIGYRAEPLIK